MDKEDKNSSSPVEVEKAKTRKQRAEDISYTLNHAIICTATDPITDPLISTYILKRLGHKSKYSSNAKAEIIGDFGAIPLTIGMQRFFPGLMGGISKLAEPVLRKPFMSGAKRDAEEWAKRHGYSVDSPEYKQREEKIYKYEITHVPQALAWTGSALLLNVGIQKSMDRKIPLHHIFAGKVGGTLTTAVITVGGRMLFPRKAEKIDHFTSEKILLPLEGKINKMLGVSDEDHHEFHKHKPASRPAPKEANWEKRIKMAKEEKISSLNM